MTEPKTAPMPPAFAEFLAQALPKDGGQHTLDLGERHVATEHLKFLKEHLPELKEKYGLTTIGSEKDVFFNVFLWAYADGTLKQQLGSKEKAQDYLRAVFVAYSDQNYKEHALEEGNLAIAAMDAGMEVTTFDSRFTLANSKQEYFSEIKLKNQYLERLAKDNDNNPSVETFRSNIRKDSKQLNNLSRFVKFPWLLGEVDWLLGLKPEYKIKLDAMERLIEVGHREIGAKRLTSDGLSAVLQTAQMADRGNSLTISGVTHISGISSYHASVPEAHPEQIHGTFGKHLFAMGQRQEFQRPHTVTAAVIATVADADIINRHLRDTFCSPRSIAIAGHQVAHLNLDDGTLGQMWQPEQDNHYCVVPLEKKFPVPDGAAAKDLPAIHLAHLDPLKNQAIKEAFDKLKTVMLEPSTVPNRYVKPPASRQLE